MIEDSYKSIEFTSSGIFKDKGSKFLSFAYPVETESEIKEIISTIKKEYFDARHHCYAYRLGYKGDIWRVNDDGEPSSTAGRPIYGQILSNELSDILIVVVRYFGGTKLGVPGLIKAYKTASSEAISKASICEKIATTILRFSFDYIQMNDIMKALKEFNIVPSSQIFDNNCLIEANVRLRDEDKFKDKISSIATILT